MKFTFKVLEKLTFSQMIFGKISKKLGKKFKALNVLLVRNTGIGFTTVKI